MKSLSVASNLQRRLVDKSETPSVNLNFFWGCFPSSERRFSSPVRPWWSQWPRCSRRHGAVAQSHDGRRCFPTAWCRRSTYTGSTFEAFVLKFYLFKIKAKHLLTWECLKRRCTEISAPGFWASGLCHHTGEKQSQSYRGFRCLASSTCYVHTSLGNTCSSIHFQWTHYESAYMHISGLRVQNCRVNASLRKFSSQCLDDTYKMHRP